MTQQDITEKQNYLLAEMQDLVSDLLYYNRKECDTVSREDIKKIFVDDFAYRLADRFKEELFK